MDSAKDGVIYFSMGSNLKSKDLPDEVKTSLLKMFGSLKQTVLWKFEEVLPNLPKNVHILEWAPQQAILCKFVNLFRFPHVRTATLLLHSHRVRQLSHGILLRLVTAAIKSVLK